MAMDISDQGKQRVLTVKKSNGAWNQRFVFDGDNIANIRGVVLDIHRGKDTEGNQVIVWRRHNGANQKWTVECIEEDTIQNGLIPDRPFRLITKMKSGRALTRVGKDVKITDRNNSNNDQVFVFDSKMGSIQPKTSKGLSLDIVDWGKQRTLQWTRSHNIWS